VLYLIAQMEYSETELLDSYGDDVEHLPDGSRILNMDLLKALRGEDFKYSPAGQTKRVPVVGFSEEETEYYFSVAEYTHHFGLPNGKGWNSEQQWLLDFLMTMKIRRSQIEAWHQKRAIAQARAAGK